ncbi:MAG: hypothetical protein ABRQ37_11590, partial [Candidatus Eremiobacterota bacterium]
NKKLEELEFEGSDINSIEEYSESDQQKLFLYLDNYIIELCEKDKYRTAEDVCNKLSLIVSENEKFYISDYTILELSINEFKSIDKLKLLVNKKMKKKDLNSNLIGLGYNQDEINQILNKISSSKGSYKSHLLYLTSYRLDEELKNVKEEQDKVEQELENLKKNGYENYGI